jgi:hypothetical protein
LLSFLLGAGEKTTVCGTLLAFDRENIMRKYFLCLMTFLIINAGTSLASSLDITYRGTGISFGNSKRLNGARFNLIDNGVKKINGFNFTFWKPKDNPDAVINGLALGLVASEAKEINGLLWVELRWLVKS